MKLKKFDKQIWSSTWSYRCIYNIIGVSVIISLFTLNYMVNVSYESDFVSKNSVNESKKIALTFDDGPVDVIGGTQYLLDGLAQREVAVTFFVTGQQVKANQKLTLRMVEEGHLIGNHTYHHVNLMTLSNEKIQEELESTNELISNITKEEVAFMRPPFGAWDKSLDPLTDLMVVMWDIDPKDWDTNNTSLIVEKVVTNVKENDIILLHDGYKTSADAAFEIIDILSVQGYEFVTVDELLMN